MTELLNCPLPWNIDNGAYLKDANGKTIADFRYKNGKQNAEYIISLTRASLPLSSPSEWQVPEGTMNCPICGKNEPHTHSAWTVEQERYCRPAFEKFFKARYLGKRAHSGLDPAGTYGWALPGIWDKRSGDRENYFMQATQVLWDTWKRAWVSRGGMFPEMQKACQVAASEVSPPNNHNRSGEGQ